MSGHRFASRLVFLSSAMSMAAAPAQDIDALADSLGSRFVADPAHVGLSIGVIRGRLQKSFNYGSIHRGRAVRPTQTTIYELASLTKSHTGMLLAKAVVDGKLALDDDVRRYLPANCANLTFDGYPVRIVDLANHTAGLPKNLPPFPASTNPESLVARYGAISRKRFLKAVAEGG